MDWSYKKSTAYIHTLPFSLPQLAREMLREVPQFGWFYYIWVISVRAHKYQMQNIFTEILKHAGEGFKDLRDFRGVNH